MTRVRSKSIVLLLVLALITTLGAGCKKKDIPLAEKVVASVGETEIFGDEALMWQAVLEDSSGITEWTEDNKATIKDSLKERIKEIAILSQIAKEKGLIISDSEKAEIDTQAQKFFDDMPEKYKTQGITVETAKRAFYNDALVGKIYDQTILDYIPADDEVNQALNNDQTYVESVTQDPDYFMQKVTVKHILIKTINDDGTPKSDDEQTNAKTKADEVFAKAESGEDFAKLVQEYSEDTASLETNGEYTFARGEMVGEFEEASFDMQIGEMRLVQTDYGWHIIKLEAIPEITTEDYEKFQQSLDQYKEQAFTSMKSYLQAQYFWDKYDEDSQGYAVKFNNDFWDNLSIGTIFS